MRHPTSLTVLFAPWTRSTSLPPYTPVFLTQSSSTPPLRPVKYHSPTGACLLSPSPTANNRNKCKLHQYECIADVWTPPHSTPLQAQLHSTSIYSSAVPFHGVSSVQLNSAHHCMRADMQCRQSAASRQAGGRASRQATINAHILASMQGGKAGSRQSGMHACFFGVCVFHRNKNNIDTDTTMGTSNSR